MSHPIALLNTSIITNPGSYEYEPIDLPQAQALVAAQPFESFIGHDSTASLMSTLLGVDVPMRRLACAQGPGQVALVIKLNGRPPEGTILSLEQIEAFGYSFGLLTRTK